MGFAWRESYLNHASNYSTFNRSIEMQSCRVCAVGPDLVKIEVMIGSDLLRGLESSIDWVAVLDLDLRKLDPT